jgi:hypothetical protein
MSLNTIPGLGKSGTSRIFVRRSVFGTERELYAMAGAASRLTRAGRTVDNSE